MRNCCFGFRERSVWPQSSLSHTAVLQALKTHPRCQKAFGGFSLKRPDRISPIGTANAGDTLRAQRDAARLPQRTLRQESHHDLWRRYAACALENRTAYLGTFVNQRLYPHSRGKHGVDFELYRLFCTYRHIEEVYRELTPRQTACRTRV